MRNFVVTIDGKSYSVGVEEVGESVGEVAIAPVSAAPAEDGAAVKKDQPIIVLEAMKMDNEITAPCDGKISLNTTKGANVETNAVLAVIG